MFSLPAAGPTRADAVDDRPDHPAQCTVMVPPGYRVGGWEVGLAIASGSWGSVYSALRVEPAKGPADPPEGTAAALKFLPSAVISPLQYVHIKELVRHEVEFSMHADHPRLIRTFETFVVDDPGEPAIHGVVVLAMERARRSLRDLLDTVTPPNAVPDARRVATEICEALVHLHAAGWVHGDFKPSNVLLMDDGSVRVADFGLTRHLEGTHAYAPRMGSSDFVPPEWWTERLSERGVATRQSCDIWALGVTCHQLLTGGLFPFPGVSARARAAAAQAYAEGRAELRLAEALPQVWRPVIADSLSPDHATRSRHSAAALLARIQALPADGQPTTSGTAAGDPGEDRRPVSGSPRQTARRRRPWAMLTGAVAAVAAVGVVVTALSMRGTPRSAGKAATVTVFNAEVPCQLPRTDDCRLGLARDPRERYAPANVVGHVWHGDVLTIDCYIDDGVPVGSEDGASSTRWFRVHGTKPEWLPAVRIQSLSQPPVSRCSD